MISSLIVGLVGAMISGATAVGRGVAEAKQTENLQREARGLAQQQRGDQLFANYMQQQEQAQNRELSKANLAFQQREARMGRVERQQQTQSQQQQRGIDRAVNMFSGQQQLKNNILNLWSNIGGV